MKLGFEKNITASITHLYIANKVVKVFTSEDSLKPIITMVVITVLRID